eukprot:TRINITY_DN236_c0_g1_i3.p1 TRINITY_DN236_c0_g1~~TRINITY_DN236_c0_g1_i3.p1  ORF type:complete len:1026 (+),score=269.42 TRINITY_DN236_c0_g1_i3:87-3164(+)
MPVAALILLLGAAGVLNPDLRIIVHQGPRWYPRGSRSCSENVTASGCVGGAAALAARFRAEAAGAQATVRLVGPDISSVNLWFPSGWSVNELVHDRLGVDASIIDNPFPLGGQDFESVYGWLSTSRRPQLMTNYASENAYNNAADRHLERAGVLQAGGVRVGVLVLWPPEGFALTIPLNLVVGPVVESLRRDGVDIVLLICGDDGARWRLYKRDDFAQFGADIVLPPYCNNRTGCSDDGDAVLVGGTWVAPGIDRGQQSPFGQAYAALDISLEAATRKPRAVGVRAVPVQEELPAQLRDSPQYRTDLRWLQQSVVEPALGNNPQVGVSSNALPRSQVFIEGFGNNYLCRTDACASGLFVSETIHQRYPEFDVVVANAGSLRGSGWDAGPVYMRDIFGLMPFQNKLCAFNTTGPELYRMLEQYVQDVPPEGPYNRSSRYRGGFLQTSGLRYEFDPYRAKQRKLVRVEVRTPDGAWEPLRRGRHYSVVANEFLCGGGDSFDLEKSGLKSYPFTAQDLMVERFRQAGARGLTMPEAGSIVYPNDSRPAYTLPPLGPDDCGTTQRHVPQWSDCVECPEGMVTDPIDPEDCAHPPGADADKTWIWVLVGVGGLIVLVVPPVGWRMTENWRRIRRLHNKEQIAINCAESIAAMRLEEVDYIKDIPKPDRIQRAFIDIISVLTEYRTFLPQALLVGQDDEDESEQGQDAQTEASTSRAAGARAIHVQPKRSSLRRDNTANSSFRSMRSSVHSAATGEQVRAGGGMRGPHCFVDSHLSKKLVTILWAGVAGTHQYFEGKTGQVPAARFHAMVKTILQAVETARGVLDHLSGDRAMVSFGAVRNCGHRLAVLRSALGIVQVTKDAGGQSYVGTERGSAHVGTIGTDTTRKHTVMGPVVNVAYACSRVAQQHSVPAVAGARLASETDTEVQYWALCALRGAKLSRAPSRALVLLEIVALREQQDNDEWMYQMADAAKGDPYAEWNKQMLEAAAGSKPPEAEAGDTQAQPTPDREGLMKALTDDGPAGHVPVDVAF